MLRPGPSSMHQGTRSSTMATWRALALGSTSLLRWELTPGNVGQHSSLGNLLGEILWIMFLKSRVIRHLGIDPQTNWMVRCKKKDATGFDAAHVATLFKESNSAQGGQTMSSLKQSAAKTLWAALLSGLPQVCKAKRQALMERNWILHLNTIAWCLDCPLTAWNPGASFVWIPISLLMLFRITISCHICCKKQVWNCETIFWREHVQKFQLFGDNSRVSGCLGRANLGPRRRMRRQHETFAA